MGDAIEYVVTWGLNHRILDSIRAIGVDEIQYAKGHKYLTLVYQIDQGITRLALHQGAHHRELPRLVHSHRGKLAWQIDTTSGHFVQHNLLYDLLFPSGGFIVPGRRRVQGVIARNTRKSAALGKP